MIGDDPRLNRHSQSSRPHTGQHVRSNVPSVGKFGLQGRILWCFNSCPVNCSLCLTAPAGALTAAIIPAVWGSGFWIWNPHAWPSRTFFKATAKGETIVPSEELEVTYAIGWPDRALDGAHSLSRSFGLLSECKHFEQRSANFKSYMLVMNSSKNQAFCVYYFCF